MTFKNMVLAKFRINRLTKISDCSFLCLCGEIIEGDFNQGRIIYCPSVDNLHMKVIESIEYIDYRLEKRFEIALGVNLDEQDRHILENIFKPGIIVDFIDKDR